MQIDIQSRGFSLTNSLMDYAQQRVKLSMAYCCSHVSRIVIRLSDINGPRGGPDKRCNIQVVLEGMPDVVVHNTEINLYDAIDRAVDRTRRAVVKKVDRQMTLLRNRAQPVLLVEQLQ